MKIIISWLLLLSSVSVCSQQPDWQHKDLTTDSVFGISTGKAYEFLKGKKSKTVIVAVIDAGIDTSHADLKSVLWINSKERKGNKKDDDKNKYTDDIFGWSFLGSAAGNVRYDNSELTRLVREGKKKFGDPGNLPADTTGLAAYESLRKKLNSEYFNAKKSYDNAKRFSLIIDTILIRMGTNNPSLTEVSAYRPHTSTEANVKGIILNALKSSSSGFESFRKENVDVPLAHYDALVNYALNLDFDPRSLVGDNYSDVNEKYYGVTDVAGPDATHGTHVSGIIGAVRHNNIGMDGVADNVRIMTIRAVPDGDERDKDIANSIRYAVDNGAKVINMSFGKAYSTNKNAVDEAVKYAMRKDVLIVHAAGNSSLNLDIKPNYPTKKYADGSGSAEAWLEVGASDAKDNFRLVASFSNYGYRAVDVFAPGVQVYSTVPGSQYEYLDGTSMAAPVVSGIAALLRSYYPKLTAVQVKDIIMNSVSKVNHQVYLSAERRNADFSDLCISGGIVNAFEAVKLAQQVSGGVYNLKAVKPAVSKDKKNNTRPSLDGVPAIDYGTPANTVPAQSLPANKAASHDTPPSPDDSRIADIQQRLSPEMVKIAAPDFSLVDLEGNTVNLSALKGKTIVLDFWATWCIPCINSFPAMELAINKYKADSTVQFLFIHTFERTEAPQKGIKKFLSDNKFNFQVLLDLKDRSNPMLLNKVAAAYMVSGLPLKIIIDPMGNIRFQSMGFLSGKNEEIVDELSAMIEMARSGK